MRFVPSGENRRVGGSFGVLVWGSRMRPGDKFVVVASPEIPITVAVPYRR